jgi:hypothetical protein
VKDVRFHHVPLGIMQHEPYEFELNDRRQSPGEVSQEGRELTMLRNGLGHLKECTVPGH